MHKQLLLPANRFRSRDTKFNHQKDKYGKRHQNLPDKGWKDIFPASDFQFDPVNLTCICPTGESLKYHATRADQNGQSRGYCQDRLLQCHRFSLRVKKKVHGQWQLYCLVHNIDEAGELRAVGGVMLGDRRREIQPRNPSRKEAVWSLKCTPSFQPIR